MINFSIQYKLCHHKYNHLNFVGPSEPGNKIRQLPISSRIHYLYQVGSTHVIISLLYIFIRLDILHNNNPTKLFKLHVRIHINHFV